VIHGNTINNSQFTNELSQLLELGQNYYESNHLELYKKINTTWKNNMDNKDISENEQDKLINNVKPEKHNFVKYSLLSWKPKVMAKEITNLEIEIFNDIRLNQFLKMHWDKKEKDELSPTISIIFDWFNCMTYIYITELLINVQIQNRVCLLSHLINLCWQAKRLKNYNLTFEILSALKHNAVSRLNKTWALINKKDMQKFEECDILFNGNNFDIYRDEIKKLLELEGGEKAKKLIPFICVLLKDLTGFEALPLEIEGLINIRKLRRIANNLNDFKSYLKPRVKWTPDTDFWDFMSERTIVKDEDQLQVLSYQCEARKN